LFSEQWHKDLLININFPDSASESVRGMQVTAQGKRKLGDELLERIDPRGEPYVWIGGLRVEEAFQEGTDLHAVAGGYISVTPIHMDMTHRASFERLRVAAFGDNVYFISRQVLYCLDRISGGLRWTRRLGFVPSARPSPASVPLAKGASVPLSRWVR
jgi:hypothetical protein